MRVSVVGLGKIGLPLAVQFGMKGFTVFGIDISSDVVAKVNEGREPFPGEDLLGENLRDVREKGRLSATQDFSAAIPLSEVVVVVVPLVVDAKVEPDFTPLKSATEEIGRYLVPGTLVIYETTLPIGTTRTVLKPILERTSGLLESEGFHLVYSPERVFSGRIFSDLRRYPKLIGALGSPGRELATAFYESALDFDVREDLERPNGVWDLGSPEATEFAKLAETTYRDVNIALANQFAIHAQSTGVDVFKVIEACNSQPFSHIHRPGISVGGHCIPVYPHLYMASDRSGGVVQESRTTNSEVPSFAVDSLVPYLAPDDVVLILGLAYRNGVKEDAFSGTYSLAKRLSEKGLIPVVSDELFNDEEIRSRGLVPFGPHNHHPKGLIIHTDHAQYRNLGATNFPTVEVVFDGRAILDPSLWGDCRLIVFGQGEETIRN